MGELAIAKHQAWDFNDRVWGVDTKTSFILSDSSTDICHCYAFLKSWVFLFQYAMLFAFHIYLGRCSTLRVIRFPNLIPCEHYAFFTGGNSKWDYLRPGVEENQICL